MHNVCVVQRRLRSGMRCAPRSPRYRSWPLHKRVYVFCSADCVWVRMAPPASLAVARTRPPVPHATRSGGGEIPASSLALLVHKQGPRWFLILDRASSLIVNHKSQESMGICSHGASDLSECGVLLQIAQEMELLDGVEELEQSFGDSLGSRRSFAAPDVTSQ